jgi:hypothetical protein
VRLRGGWRSSMSEVFPPPRGFSRFLGTLLPEWTSDRQRYPRTGQIVWSAAPLCGCVGGVREREQQAP